METWVKSNENYLDTITKIAKETEKYIWRNVSKVHAFLIKLMNESCISFIH
jgi:hypothetical protein